MGRIFNGQGSNYTEITDNFIQGASLSGNAGALIKFGGSTVVNKDMVANTINGKQPFAFELGIGTPGWDLSFGGVSDKNLSPVDYLKKINREVEAKEIERILNKAPEGASIGNVLDQWHKSF